MTQNIHAGAIPHNSRRYHTNQLAAVPSVDGRRADV
jgi:hypothetical protein